MLFFDPENEEQAPCYFEDPVLVSPHLEQYQEEFPFWGSRGEHSLRTVCDDVLCAQLFDYVGRVY